MSPESQLIYETIRERIGLLQYPPGEMISENALATEFSVSRTRMRRVLWRLEHDGLIRISQGSGAVVTAVDIKSLKEVYVVRRKLLELVGELKPARITDENIASLTAILDQSQELKKQRDPITLAKLYNQYHYEMLKIVGNDFLRRIMDQLYYQTERVWVQLLPDLNWAEEVKIMNDEIRDVVAALRATDLHLVAEARRRHMSMLMQRINNYLGSADAE